MVTSRDWTISTYSKDAKAKECVKQLMDPIFWKQDVDIVKLYKPLFCVLHIVDSEDKPTMDFLYQAIYKTGKRMTRRFQRNKKKVECYLSFLNNH